MPLVFRVINAGRESITLQLMGRTPTADFLVSDTADRPVWSRLRGRTMLGSLQLYPLARGRSLVFREQWDQRTDHRVLVPPGAYRIRGVLLTDAPGGLASAPVLLRIEP